MDFLEILTDYTRSYYESAQIPLAIYDEALKPMITYGGACNYCKIFKKMLGGSGLCEKRHIHGCDESALQNQAYIFSCPGGLVHFAVSLKQNNRQVCNVIAGPVLLEFPQMSMAEDVLEQYGLPLSGRAELFSAMKAIPLIEPQKIKYLSRLLYQLIGHLPDMLQQIIKKQQEDAAQKKRIDAYLEAIQEDDEQIKSRNHTTQLYDLEQELVSAIYACNLSDAKATMGDLFALHCAQSGNHTNFITVRAIELITLVSRIAVEAGANVYKMYGYTDKSFKYLMDAESTMEISLLLQKSVSDAISLIYIPFTDNNTSLIRQSLHYIHQNYRRAISLEQVSKNVNLSESYFSAMFKEETGESFTHYVNRMRIDAAKKILLETDQPLLDVALELGFGSQSYFSSVFKKIVGISPKQYRLKTV